MKTIFLDTDNEELFNELKSYGWTHPISKYVKPGEVMRFTLETQWHNTTVRVIHSVRSELATNEFINWLAKQIGQIK